MQERYRCWRSFPSMPSISQANIRPAFTRSTICKQATRCFSRLSFDHTWYNRAHERIAHVHPVRWVVHGRRPLTLQGYGRLVVPMTCFSLFRLPLRRLHRSMPKGPQQCIGLRWVGLVFRGCLHRIRLRQGGVPVGQPASEHNQKRN